MKMIFVAVVISLTLTSAARSQEPAQPRPGPTPRSSPLGRSVPPQAEMPKQAGKAIAFEFLLAEVAGAAGDLAAEKVLQLEKDGKLSSVQRLQLTTLEELPAFVQVGELAARVTGRTIVGGRSFGGGPSPTSTPIYNDVNVGTNAQVTARIDEDGSIIAQIYLERSALPPTVREAAAGDATSSNESAPPSVVRSLTQATVRLKAGVPSVVSARQMQGGHENSRMWLIVTAKVPQ